MPTPRAIRNTRAVIGLVATVAVLVPVGLVWLSVPLWFFLVGGRLAAK